MANRKSVVVKLSVQTLAACTDLVEMSQLGLSRGMPLGDIVSTALNALVLAVQKQGTIPRYDEQGALARISHEGPLITLPPIHSYPDEEWVNPLYKPQMPTPDFEDRVADAMSKISTKGIVADGELVNPNPTPFTPPSVSINLMDMESTPFEAFLILAPDDPVITRANTEEEKKATAVIYTNLPKSLWGTEKASQLIEDLLEKSCKSHANNREMSS